MENNQNEQLEKNIESTEVEAEETVETEEVVNTEEVVEETPVEQPYDGKQATTYICYDYKTLKGFTMYNTVVKRKGVLKYVLFSSVALLLAIYVIVSAIIKNINATEKSDLTYTFIMGGVCVLFAVYVFIQAFKFEAQVDKAIVRHLYEHKQLNEQNIIVREDKVTIVPLSRPTEKYDYEWYQISSIDEIDGYILLFVGKMPIIIETDPSKVVNGSYQDMIDIIKENIQIKPFKKYEKKLFKQPIPEEYNHEVTPKYYLDLQNEQTDENN